jgi:hypothetical protein
MKNWVLSEELKPCPSTFPMMNAEEKTQRSPTSASKDATPAVRCFSRRVWDWGGAWRDTLVHLVWFWRIGVVLAMAAAGVYAWNAPDVGPRAIATGVLFALGLLLALDLFTAMFNLPLLAFYALLWGLLTITSLLDVLFYGRHLGAKPNRIVPIVWLVNIALGVAALVLWYTLWPGGQPAP